MVILILQTESVDISCGLEFEYKVCSYNGFQFPNISNKSKMEYLFCNFI